MRRHPGGWVAHCDGEDFEAERLVDAMREAVGLARGATLQLGIGAHASIESWIAEQSARIEQEAV